MFALRSGASAFEVDSFWCYVIAQSDVEARRILTDLVPWIVISKTVELEEEIKTQILSEHNELGLHIVI